MAGARGFGSLSRGEELPMTQQNVRREEDETEDHNSECTGSSKMNTGEAEEGRLEKRPDGERGGGVEVAGDVPVTTLEVADGCIAVPAFIGVLCPVHPGRVVGKVGVEMESMQSEEEGSDEEENDLDDFESTGRDEMR
jgi:hypothetical protein